MGKKAGKEIEEEVKEIAVDAINDLLEDSKIEEDEAVEILSATLDAIIPLEHLVPGRLGKMLDEADDIIFDEIAKALVNAFKLDPDKIEGRAARAEARGHHKIAARRRRRAQRVRERQAAREARVAAEAAVDSE